MEWYWYLIIAVAIVIVFILIYAFGSRKLKDLAYELVCNAERLLGSGQGKEKYELVLNHLSELTKGKIPVSILEKAIDLGVDKMKSMLLEDKESVKKGTKENEK